MMAIDSVKTEDILHFSRYGYVVLIGVISEPHLGVYANYAMLQRFSGYYEFEEATNSQNRYADMLGESLLLHLQPVMEKVSGRKLQPTYSFLRIYGSGAVMEKHIDRPACEFSASLTLGYQASSLWPLWVESRNEAIPNLLDRGDLLVYKGCEIPHWREKFSGRYWIQMFFHYVDAKGPFADHKYDNRVMLGLPSKYRQIREKDAAS